MSNPTILLSADTTPIDVGTIGIPNTAPIAVNDTLTATNEDNVITYTAAQLLGNDIDLDGDTLTIASVTSGIVTMVWNYSWSAWEYFTSSTGGTAVLNADGTVSFTPDSNFNGVASFTYQVKDSTLTSDSATVTVNVTPVNDAPSGADNTVTINKNNSYIVTAADFGFSDPNDSVANTLLNVIVSSLPVATDGVYQLNGVNVAIGQRINIADINDNKLVFIPATDKNGTGLGSLGFHVQDDGGTVNGGVDTNAIANTLNFNIADVAPVAVNDTLTALEDSVTTYAAMQLLNNDTDLDGDTFTIASVTNGTVTMVWNYSWSAWEYITSSTGGTAVLNAGGIVSFTPDSNFNGVASFTYQIKDSTLTSDSATVTVNVTPVNDAPSGADNTVTINKNSSYIVTAADFGFSDPNDSVANALLNVIVSSLPVATDGVYQLNGVNVAIGQRINIADINDNKLVFTPATDKSGTDLGGLGFNVQDDGGIAHAGVDTDATANTLSFTINSDIISFNNVNSVTMPVTITDTNLANISSDFQANVTGQNTIVFVSEGPTFVPQDSGVTPTLVELVGVAANAVSTDAAASAVSIV